MKCSERVTPYTPLKYYKKQLIIGPVFKLAEAILELLIPTMMVTVIDRGIAENNSSYILKMGLLMLFIAIVGLSSALVCQYSASVASQGYGTRLRDTLYRHISELSHREWNRLGTAALINRLTGDCNILQQAVAMLIRLVIRAPFISIGSMVMAMLLDFKLSLIILCVFPLLVLIILLVMKATVPLYKKVQQHLDRLSSILRENLSGVRVIRAFTAEKKEKTRFEEENTAFTKAYIRVNKISSLLNPATAIIMNGAVLLILWAGGLRVESGHMTPGEIIAFTNYISYMVVAILVVANLVVLFSRAKASADRISEILNTKSALSEPESSLVPDKTGPALEFQEVSFSYTEGKNALEKINFTLMPGEILGIIGGTGSGKTSLINLIPRFYDPSQGSVRVFGHDVREYRLSRLRQLVGVAAQKAVLFSGTVADCIRMGNPGASDAQIIAAAKAAQAHSFITDKSNGYQEKIERGGVNFSGGQRQRLSIARTLAADPSILILDDCTGALDYATDAALWKELRELYRGTTIVLVSQRPDIVRRADKILVLEGGQSVGMGSHSHLMESCAVYREICQCASGQEDKNA